MTDVLIAAIAALLILVLYLLESSRRERRDLYLRIQSRSATEYVLATEALEAKPEPDEAEEVEPEADEVFDADTLAAFERATSATRHIA